MSCEVNLKSYITQFIKKYRIYFVSLIGIALLAGCFEISVDYKVKEILDAISFNETTDLKILLGLFVVYKFMHHGMYFFSRLLDIKYKPVMGERIISDIYTKTVRHSLHWFDSHLSGEISNKISEFQNSINVLITHLFHALQLSIAVGISFIFLFKVSYLSALLLFAFVGIYAPILYYLLQKQMKYQQRTTKARQQAMGIINDSISNIFGIKILGNILSDFKSKLKPSLEDWKNKDKITKKFDAFFVDNADTFIVTLMSAAQIYLLTYLFQNGAITAGGFAFISMMTLKIYAQLDVFLDILLFDINPAIAQLKASYAYVNSPVDVEDKPGVTSITNPKGCIEYQNVSFCYEKGSEPVLVDFNLKIEPGQKVGIVGFSGAGKTTMIKCLLRYFDVSKGGVFLDGIDIRDLSQESLRKHLTIIPQDICLFHRTIKENLKLGNLNATDEQVIQVCKQAKIHEDILKMNLGYNTVVGERGVKLSGGERQRLAIARALLKDSPILILDEATSNLDTPTEFKIQQSINSLLQNQKRTVIAIAHRLSTLKHMDRIIVLEKGKIVEIGTHEILLQKKNGLFKKLWEMQTINTYR